MDLNSSLERLIDFGVIVSTFDMGNGVGFRAEIGARSLKIEN